MFSEGEGQGSVFFIELPVRDTVVPTCDSADYAGANEISAVGMARKSLKFQIIFS